MTESIDSTSRSNAAARVLVSLLVLVLALAACGARANGARSFKTGPIQITADGAHVWVVNPDNDSVTHVDARTEPAAGSVTEHVLPGPGPHLPKGLAVREDGTEVWVACHDSDEVLVLAGTNASQAEGSLVARIALPFGSGPVAVALSRDQRLALILCHRSGRLVVADATTHAITADLETYRTPRGACFTEDGRTAWITHERVEDRLTRLGRLDVSGPVPHVVTLHRQDGSNPQDSAALRDTDPSHNYAEGGYLHFRGHLAQKPGGRVWVPTQYSNIHDTRPGPDNIFQSTLRQADMSAHSLPNTLNDKVIVTAAQVHDITTGAWIGPGWDAHVAGPVDLAFSTDGTWAYVVHELSDDVLVMRTDTTAANTSGAPPLREIAVGERPQGIAVSPSTNRAYVANFLSRSISVLDLTPGSEAELRQVPTTPTTGETKSASFLNGERLFHASEDPRISVKSKAACASCHLDGEDDGRTWDLQFLTGAHGPRATQSLLGLSLSFGPVDSATGLGQLHRSGDRDEVQDFEHTFISPQMAGTGFISPALRQPPLGAGPNAGLDPDLDDLAEYVLALQPIQRSPFRAPDGSLTESAIRGATFFRGAGGAPADASCATCHVPETGFTDLQFHDVGSFRSPAERDLNNRAPQWAVNTPTIIGSWNSPPYAGSSTQKEPETALDFLTDAMAPARTTPHGRLAGLNGRQLQDLADFLLQADGRLTAADVRNAVDDVPPRITSVKPISPTRIVVRFSESVADAAASPATWRLTGPSGDVSVVSGTLEAPDLDRVTLTVPAMGNPCGAADYTLRPIVPIFDRADSVTGGRANAMDLSNAANAAAFTLPTTFTVTFGQSGAADVRVKVHDAGANAFLDNVSNGSVYLTSPNGTPNNCSFVRFEWAPAFAALSGVTSSADITGASFTLSGQWGDSQSIEARRVLQPWWDAAQTDQTFNPPVDPISGHASPTRKYSEFNVTQWHALMAGARLAGIEGRSRADYLGAQDAAFTPDVVATMQSIVEPTVVSGPGVLDAFRFWFDNPDLDFGWVLQLQAGSLNETKFWAGEEEGRRHEPMLTITYTVPPTGGGPRPREVSGGAAAPLMVVRAPAGLRVTFEDLGAEASAYNFYEGAIPAAAGVAPWYSHASSNPGSSCGVTPAIVSGRRAMIVPSTAGRNEYFLVAAVKDCAEGPSGADSRGIEQNPLLEDCAP